ncbi:MAG: hypothetical protein HYY30_09730 [Chloroflexi bacterium]|nr:hypothetical protein [Chloroflexota bacterium]
MIVRISTEGQYRLPSAVLDELNTLDNNIVEVVAAGDTERFKSLYDQMIALVHKKGQPLKPDEILESEVILPPPDITIEDAKRLFIGGGLVPD